LVWSGREWRPPTAEELESRASAPEMIRADRMTTLDNLPGYRIVQVLGVVSGVGSKSGWTASSKGSDAQDRSYEAILEAAFELEANAIVGVSASAFGAGGGITSVLGGDAVGVLYVGTAVVVEAIDD